RRRARVLQVPRHPPGGTRTADGIRGPARSRSLRKGHAMSANGQNGDGLIQLTAKDFKTDQEVRWCPGCGDYAILAAVQGFMPELGIPRERIVFISGIGCAARFP